MGANTVSPARAWGGASGGTDPDRLLCMTRLPLDQVAMRARR